MSQVALFWAQHNIMSIGLFRPAPLDYIFGVSITKLYVKRASETQYAVPYKLSEANEAN